MRKFTLRDARVPRRVRRTYCSDLDGTFCCLRSQIYEVKNLEKWVKGSSRPSAAVETTVVARRNGLQTAGHCYTSPRDRKRARLFEPTNTNRSKLPAIMASRHRPTERSFITRILSIRPIFMYTYLARQLSHGRTPVTVLICCPSVHSHYVESRANSVLIVFENVVNVNVLNDVSEWSCSNTLTIRMCASQGRLRSHLAGISRMDHGA